MCTIDLEKTTQSSLMATVIPHADTRNQTQDTEVESQCLPAELTEWFSLKSDFFAGLLFEIWKDNFGLEKENYWYFWTAAIYLK